MRPHVSFRKIACVANVAPLGGPPACSAGENDGDEIEAFYHVTCEGEYLRPSQSDAPLTALESMDVYEAYRIPQKTASGYQYSVVLIDHDPAREGYAWEAIIDTGEMIGLLFSCSLSAEELVTARHYDQPVPTPAPTAIATPVP